MRRSTLLLLAVAAIVLAACEIRTDYDMFISADSSAQMSFEITYDGEAAQLFGPAEQFLEEEIEEDVGEEIDGITLLSAEADSSDPDQQRVTATFGAQDGEAFDMFVEDLFPGSSFTNTEGDIWVLNLRPDDDVAEDFDDEFPLDEFGLDFISGEVRLGHEGSQVSMTGGEAGSGNLVIWDPYGPDPLEVVMDLSGATPAGEPEEPEEPAEEPAEEPDEVEEPAEEPAEEPEEVEEPTEEAEDGLAAEEGDPAAAVGEDDDGISTLLLVGLAVGLLLLLLIIFLIVRSRGKKKQAADQSQQPVGAGVGAGAAGGWDQQNAGQWDQNQYGQQPAQGWDQSQYGQQPAQGWDQSQQPAGQWDQTQAMQPPAQSWEQPQTGQPTQGDPSQQPPAQSWDQSQQPTQGWDQPPAAAPPQAPADAGPSAPPPPSGPPTAPPAHPGDSDPSPTQPDTPASGPSETAQPEQAPPPADDAPPEDDGRPGPPKPPPPPPAG